MTSQLFNILDLFCKRLDYFSVFAGTGRGFAFLNFEVRNSVKALIGKPARNSFLGIAFKLKLSGKSWNVLFQTCCMWFCNFSYCCVTALAMWSFAYLNCHVREARCSSDLIP